MSPSGPCNLATGGSSSPRPSRTRSLNQDNTASLDSSSPLQAWIRLWIHKGLRMRRAQETMTVVCENHLTQKYLTGVMTKTFYRSRLFLWSWNSNKHQKTDYPLWRLLFSHIFARLCSCLGRSKVCKQKHKCEIAKNDLDSWDIALSVYCSCFTQYWRNVPTYFILFFFVLQCCFCLV